MAQTGYTPISLYYSTTASAVPTAGNLANGELAINITDGKLYYKNNSGVVTLLAGSGGAITPITNNGVVYVNSSGQATSGSALTYNGTTFSSSNTGGSYLFKFSDTTNNNSLGLYSDATNMRLMSLDNTFTTFKSMNFYGTPFVFYENGTEAMRLNSTGLGVGTSNPSGKIHSQVATPSTAGIASIYYGGDGTKQFQLLQTGATYNTAGAGGNELWYYTASYSALTFGSDGNIPIKWVSNGSEQMRLTSTGLGIGTSSPATQFVVSNAGAQGVEITGSNGSIQVYNRSTAAYGVMNLYGNTIYFRTGTSPAINATIDASGNLGLGVTPSAWNTYTALQVKTASLWSGNSLNSFASLTANAYYQGGYKYIASDYATEYYQYQGAHIWRTAASGTAGNAITFTQAMTLNASGALGFGNTPSYGTSGQVLTSGGSGAAPTWTTVAAGSAATPTALGTVYGNTSSSAFNTQLGYQAGNSNTGQYLTAIGYVAGVNNTNSTYGNVMVGSYAGNANTSGSITAIGNAALYSNTTGASNTAMSVDALRRNTTGSYNTAIGDSALAFNTTTNFNVAVGYKALYANTAAGNTAVGDECLDANTTGINLAAFGTEALGANTTGSNNSAFGSYSLYNNTTASNNTAVGYQAGYSNTTGASNVFVGRQAGYAITTSGQNTVIGDAALNTGDASGTANTVVGGSAGQNISGGLNTAVGHNSMRFQGTGSSNCAFGYGTLGLLNSPTVYNFSNSTAIGASSLSYNTASDNTAVGYFAAYANTTGTYNVSVGAVSMRLNTTGSNNTALGYNALYSNSTASGSTAVGYQAAYSSTTGPGNTAIGYQALYNNTNGSTNIGIGYQAGYGLRTNTLTPGQNIAIGNEALYSSSHASYNIAIGYQALRAAGDAGGASVAIGQQAGRLCATPASSVFIGYAAAYTATYWIGGTCVGTNAGFSYNDPGTPYPGNTFVGDGAGYKVSTGGGNTFVGGGGSGYSNGPGYNTTTGYQNTGMGTGALAANVTGGNSTGIGYVAFSNQTGGENTGLGSYAGVYNFGSGAATVGGNRNVFLGAYTIASGASDSNCIIIGAATVGKGSNTGFINPNSGGVYQGNNSSSWSTTSDQRLKKNIVDNTVGLSAINSIRVRNFEYRLEDEITELSKDCAIKKEGVQLGVIAQELQAVLPDCVKQETTGVLSVDPDNLTWYMVNAIKELNAKIEAQAAEIAILKGQA